MLLKKNYCLYLLKILPIISISIEKEEITLIISVHNLKKLLFFLKFHTNTQYKILTDICAVDYIERQKRFEIIYNFLSLRFNTRIFVKIQIDEFTMISSIKNIYKNSSWYEREVWDMFGIFFFDHIDLRRLLTDYGFEGYPLRKDFPLTGYLEVQYSEIKKRILYKPIQMTQEYRLFSFENPWSIIY